MSKYSGEWKIIEMELWDQEYIDLVEPGYFYFDDDGMGEFVFGTVNGTIDARIDSVNGKVRLEYSWEGDSDNDEACGRGWFECSENSKLYGKIFIHNGDDSMVTLQKI